MMPLAGPLAIGAACLAAVGWGLWSYPLPPWPLAAALLAYGAVLARWPAAFLLVLPVVLPALDLGLWTGWMMVGEADLFLLVTLAVLLVRTPPAARDLWPGGAAGPVLAAFLAMTALALAIGLAAPFGHDPASANSYLRPENALRLAKGFAAALLLLPFLRRRQRLHGDAPRLLAMGMLLGLGAVALQVAAERMLFAALLDFETDYRVVGAFSSMQVGGGHIGAWLAMALPFLLAFGWPRSLGGAALLAAVAVAGLYALAVTYARTGYLAGAAGLGVAALVWLAVLRRRGGGRVAWLAALPVAALLGGLGLAASSEVMRERIALIGGDWQTRVANWQAGWAVRDGDPVTLAVGMGLGTYQRAMLARSAVNRPSDIALGEDAEGRFVTLSTESPFFLGQKLVPPPGGPLRFTARIRADDARAAPVVLLCEKMLVYSDNCRDAAFEPDAPGAWEPGVWEPGAWKEVSATLDAAGLGRGVLGLARPLEFSIHDERRGSRLSIRDIALTDAEGRNLLANADFAHGLDRWLLTDDSHVSWRILNQSLMLLFETGVLGLAAFLALAGLALAGAVRAAGRGVAAGAAVAGALASFLVSGLFDNVLEAPRVAATFHLIALTGLLLWEAPGGAAPGLRPDGRRARWREARAGGRAWGVIPGSWV